MAWSSRYSAPSFGSCCVCFYSLSDGPCFMAFKLLFLCAVLLTKNRALHQRLSGWACRLSVCLSLCLSVCLLLLSSRQPPAPVYMSQAFVYCSVVDGSSFHVAPVVRSSRSKCWRGEIWPHVACLSSGWKCAPQKHTLHVHPVAQKNMLSLGLSLCSCVRFQQEI